MARDFALSLPTGRIAKRVGFDPSEPLLIPHREGTRFPALNGADTAFFCTTREGLLFFCKDDKDGRPIRATEMLTTRLASRVGIATPHCSVIECRDGETVFGSLKSLSLAAEIELQTFLLTPERDELGGPRPWLKRYLSGLYAFDLFVANPDRSMGNFLLEMPERRLCAYDFASARLKMWSDERIAIEESVSTSVGRRLRRVHGFELEAALEMVERLGAVPESAIRMMLSDLPEQWISKDQGESLRAGWRNGSRARLAALSAGLKDGSLI